MTSERRTSGGYSVQPDVERLSGTLYADFSTSNTDPVNGEMLDVEGEGIHDHSIDRWSNTADVLDDQIHYPGVLIVVYAAVDRRSPVKRMIVLEGVWTIRVSVEEHHLHELRDERARSSVPSDPHFVVDLPPIGALVAHVCCGSPACDI